MRFLRRSGKVVVIVLAIATAVSFGFRDQDAAATLTLPATAHGYLGVYTPTMPASTNGLTAFESETATRPNVAVYYSGWLEPFQYRFAADLAARGAVPLVQINPAGINLASIVAGKYNSYLATFAQSVRSYGHPVIISFGHEMNGNWYPWGNGKASPATFVAAWRHIVKAFRSSGAYNVTWLWTINSLAGGPGAAVSPKPWWPGAAYVTWVGIDGYFYYRGESFATLFGGTIAAVRRLTRDPVLIAETAAAPVAGQAAKVWELFTGVRSDGLLGLVWFDDSGYRDWVIDHDSAALSAFKQAAQGFGRASLPTAEAAG
jgi:mannan endo-1,4-beta-mannosidase